MNTDFILIIISIFILIVNIILGENSKNKNEIIWLRINYIIVGLMFANIINIVAELLN